MGPYIFESKRLGGRPWLKNDYPKFAEINQDEMVMRFFPKTLTHSDSNNLAARYQSRLEHFGYSYFAVDHLEDKRFIGCIGLQMATFASSFTPCIEIGWRLDKNYWNQGLATEGELACLDYGFSSLGFTEVYSFTSPLNVASETVMRKIGMKKIGNFEHPNLPDGHVLKLHLLYKIDLDTHGIQRT